jgi:hypothetical protein
MNLKTPLKLLANKPSAFGFVTGEIRDADGNCVMSGLFRDHETADGIVTRLNEQADEPETEPTTPAPQTPS